MKLRDIVAKLDKSKSNEDDEVYWDLESFVLELELNCHDVKQGSNNPRLKCYWVANHLCTDTWVGIRAYFLDEEFVCLSTQQGRKCDETFEWVSKDSFHNVKNYITSLQDEEEYDNDPVDFLDMEEDFGEGYPIEFTGQCLRKNVLWKSKEVTIVKDDNERYTNFHTITVVEKDTSRQVDIDVREILVPWYTR